MMADEYDWEAAWAKPEPAAQIIPLPPTTTDGATPYGTKALTDELYTLANTSEGSRNDQLNRSAFNLAQLVAAGHLPPVETQQQLRATALTIGLPASEVDATLRSAFRAGTQHPRDVPDLPARVEVIEIRIDPETGEAINPSESGDQTAVDRRYLELSNAVLNLDGLRSIPPPIPIIEGYLFRNSLAWLGGKPGHGKSFVAVEIGCCIATGTPWHNHQTEQGTVLYLIAEGASGLAQRVEAWTLAHGKPADNLLFLPVPVQMADTYSIDVAAFGMLLKTIQPTLVIIDTQARVTVGAEENSAKDMGKFVHSLELLRMHCQATILVVHHEPRNGENLRGSISLEGAATTIIRASKDGNLVTLSNPKQKDIIEREPLELALEPRGDSAILVRAGMANRTHNITDTGQEILRVLQGFGPGGCSTTTLIDAVGTPKKTFYRNLNALIDADLVTRKKVGNSVNLEVTLDPDLEA